MYLNKQLKKIITMKPIKNVLIVIILLTGFIFGVSFSTLYAQTHISQGSVCSCTLPIPILIPTFSSLGVFIGSVVYYLFFPKIEENSERYLKDTRALIDLLTHEEAKLIRMIVENGGKITQNKLSSPSDRVKVHRTLKNLELRGIIKKEPYGKTNMIRLTKKFSEILSTNQ